MDFSTIRFNKDHKREAAAKDAATGMRLLLVSLPIAIVGVMLASLGTVGLSGDPLLLLGMLVSLAASAMGAYGAYLAATALGWSKFINMAIVLSIFVPYLKFLMLIVLIAFSMQSISDAGYRIALFGPLRKR